MQQLRRREVRFVAVNLEPVFGSMDAYLPILDAAVSRLERATGLAPVVVTHSMGGLAARAWAANQPDVGRYHRIVTIGTPHQGTKLAAASKTPNGRQMQVDSAWLVALRARESETAASRMTCFWSHCDNIVFPTENATLPGASNRHLPSTPHVRMVNHPEVLAEVLRQVDSITD